MLLLQLATKVIEEELIKISKEMSHLSEIQQNLREKRYYSKTDKEMFERERNQEINSLSELRDTLYHLKSSLDKGREFLDSLLKDFEET